MMADWDICVLMKGTVLQVLLPLNAMVELLCCLPSEYLSEKWQAIGIIFYTMHLSH